MNRMHPYANVSKPAAPKPVLRRRVGDAMWDALPPKAVPENMDPENADEVGRTFARTDPEALQASIAAYHAREAECVEAAPSGRNIVLGEERGRFFELGAAPLDLRGDARSLSDVAEVKPPVDAWDSLAAEVLDHAIDGVSAFRLPPGAGLEVYVRLYFHYVGGPAPLVGMGGDAPVDACVDKCLRLIGGPISLEWIQAVVRGSMVYADRYFHVIGGPVSVEHMYGAAFRRLRHDVRMDVHADRCFLLTGGSLSQIKAALHTSMAEQLHDLIERTDSRLEHLKSVTLPQFSVRTKAAERATADPASWSEDFHKRVPDALTQRFRLRRVTQKTIGFDATPTVFETMLRVRDEMLSLA